MGEGENIESRLPRQRAEEEASGRKSQLRSSSGSPPSPPRARADVSAGNNSNLPGHRPSAPRFPPALRPRHRPPAPAPASSTASPAPRGDHNMAAAPGLLFWLLLLGPPWRVPGQPEPDTNRRFSEYKLCADNECSSEWREGDSGAEAARGRELGSPHADRGLAGRGRGDPRVPAFVPCGSAGARWPWPLGAAPPTCCRRFIFSLLARRGGVLGVGGGPRFGQLPASAPPARPARSGDGVSAARPAPHAASERFPVPAAATSVGAARGQMRSGLGGWILCGRLMVGLGKGALALPLRPSASLGFGAHTDRLEFRFGTSAESRQAEYSHVSAPALPQSCHFCA